MGVCIGRLFTDTKIKSVANKVSAVLPIWDFVDRVSIKIVLLIEISNRVVIQI